MRPRRIVLGVVVLFLGALVLGLHRGARAAGVLLRFGGETGSALASYDRAAIRTTERPIVLAGRRMENDVHRPVGTPRGAMLLVHGMHFLGHREPRLVALADAFAAAGVEVWTPRIESLASYRLEADAIRDVGLAARELARARRVEAVPVFGISFAGGISLLTAADPALGRSIAGVVALGAQDDLARVARWFAGEEARGPSGERVSIAPHPYGAQLFLGEEPARFFGEADARIAGELMQLCLHGEWRAARAREPELSPRSRAVLEASIAGRLDDATRAALLAMVQERAASLAVLSPRGRVSGLRIPVLLLHGAEDPIVPATEASYLAREIPGAEVLVTEALRHAEGAEEASAEEKLALVRFVDRVLGLAGGS